MLSSLTITRVHVKGIGKELYALNILAMPNDASWSLTRTLDELVTFTQQLARMAKGEGILLEALKPASWWHRLTLSKIQAYFDGLFGSGSYPRWLTTSEPVWEFLLTDLQPLSASNGLLSMSVPYLRVCVGGDTIKVEAGDLATLNQTVQEKLGVKVKCLSYTDHEGDVIRIHANDELQAALRYLPNLTLQAD